jgi:hypothetical protein
MRVVLKLTRSIITHERQFHRRKKQSININSQLSTVIY